MTAFWRTNQRYIMWGTYAIATLLILMWLGPIIGNQKISRMIQTTVSGVLVGGIYALVGLGIVVVTKASGVFNFAHGFMMVIGGLIFWTFFTTSEVTVGFGAALLLAFATVFMWMTIIIEKPDGEIWESLSENIFGRLMIAIGIPQLLKPNNLAKLIGVTLVLALLMTFGGTNWNWIELQESHWVYSPTWKWLHSIVGTITGSILLGLVIERFTIRPLVGQPLFAMVLMTLAVSEVLQGFVQFSWGPLDRTMPIFSVFTDLGIPSPIRFNLADSEGLQWFLNGIFDFGRKLSINTPTSDELSAALDGRIIIRTELLLAFIVAIIAVIGFIIFFRYAQTGLAMRAVSEDQQLAQSVGLRVREILAIVWAIAALLAGFAGVLQGGSTSMTPLVGLVALRAFPAVLLGGLESIEGVLVGGIVIGLVEQWANLLFAGTQAGPRLAPYVVLMIVLVIRPEGLFGEKLIERI